MSRQLFRKKNISLILKDAEMGISDDTHHGGSLKKVLGVRDLTAMGIAAIVGAGIFSTIGQAAYNGGPGVILLFVITAICCGFSAMCYAAFASRIPVSGSAYTYAYASFGELVAWIIGWDLLMEYAIGNIAVAISWSGYFTDLLDRFNLHIPYYFTTDYITAFRGFQGAQHAMASGSPLSSLPDKLKAAFAAWTGAPQLAGIRIIANLPALAIVFFITYLVYIGIRETKKATNLMVALKVAIVLFVIIVGFFYVNPVHWHPFLPNGMGGVMKGVSGVFFAYIGFDAISTTAEECKNPQRDLPRGMIYSLLICTVLYILVAIVLTGMVSYNQLLVTDPLSYVFREVKLYKISYIVSISAVIATASVLLVFQMGQPRIWMSMSRDGLLPKIFSRLHPKFGTPSFSVILTGLLVAIPSLFLNFTVVTDLTSIGTLFAFVLVCGGILLIPDDPTISNRSKRFHIPYINSRYIVPLLFIIGLGLFRIQLAGLFRYNGIWVVFRENLPYYLFLILSLTLSILSYIKKLSLIPVLGLGSCFFLMTELGYLNWLRFLIWLVVGLVIYFTYSFKHSKLNLTQRQG
ncbi:MAG TPA: amino acid permease [Chitinophagaceae bacterium]|nr:amino acid permease [Chitinophagaceae bacterium]